VIDLANQELHMQNKMGAKKVRAKLKRIKMLAPRSTRGGKEKP